MNTLKKIFYIITASIMLWSCDSILDTEPKQSISEDLALTTSDNVKSVLLGAYDELGDGDLWGGILMMDPDLLGDSGDKTWSGTFEAPRQIFFKTIRVNNFDVESLWLDAYATINIVNNVLSALEVVDEADRERVRGECLFIRGSLYFELVRLFGKAWNDGNPSQNAGVPIVTEPTREITEENEVPRNTVEEVYQQVITDLSEAKNLLPEENGFYATTYAASAILSRVYLQQGDDQNAATEANRVIESGLFTLVQNYADEFNNTSDENTTEDIFAMQVVVGDNENNDNSLHTFYASQNEGGRGDIEIQQQHIARYDTTNDERYDLFYADGNEIRTGKWKDEFGNVNVVRLAEMYLTRAESNQRLGAGSYVGPNTPGQDLTIIRNRAGLSDNLAPSLQDIISERFIELAFEGLELHDKKRLQQNVGGLSWNDPSLVYPVPLREINSNKNLTQNEGYGGSN